MNFKFEDEMFRIRQDKRLSSSLGQEDVAMKSNCLDYAKQQKDVLAKLLQKKKTEKINTAIIYSVRYSEMSRYILTRSSQKRAKSAQFVVITQCNLPVFPRLHFRTIAPVL